MTQKLAIGLRQSPGIALLQELSRQPNGQLLTHFRSRNFTLLEVMIALALASMLVTFLFGFYKEIALQKIAAEKWEEKHFEEAKVQMRLTEIFSKVFLDDEQLFHSRGGELIFTFENGIDADPRFSGRVKGHLTVSKKRLELRITPLDEKASERTEALMQNVERISTQFFDMTKTKLDWGDGWEKEDELPGMIKLTVHQKEDRKIEFAFFLSPSNLPAEYS